MKTVRSKRKNQRAQNELRFKYNRNGTFTVTKGKMYFYKDWEVFVPPGTITNFPSIPAVFKVFLDPLDYVDESTLHDALVGEYGDPVTIRHIKTGKTKEATWKEAAKWFKHELNKNHNKFISQLFYFAVMQWKRFR